MNNAGSIYVAQHGGDRIAVYLAGEWGSSSRSSSNAASATWTTEVTMHAKGKSDVTLKWSSGTPKQVVVNGTPFDPAAGSVFRVASSGTVEQLPFSPLRSDDQAYLKQLNAYFAH